MYIFKAICQVETPLTIDIKHGDHIRAYQLSTFLVGIGDRNIVSVWTRGRRKDDHASLRHATSIIQKINFLENFSPHNATRNTKQTLVASSAQIKTDSLQKDNSQSSHKMLDFVC